MKIIEKDERKQSLIIVAVIIVLAVLLYNFPIWRYIHVGPVSLGSYYTGKEIGMAVSRGSLSDRWEVKDVLRLAEKAFEDITHTSIENEKV